MEYKYKKIAENIRAKIKNGQYKAGDLIPDQSQIAKEFNTTRSTVHKALDLLVIEGMIYSKRGAGTFVRKDFNLDTKYKSVSALEKPLGATYTHQDNKITSKVLSYSARLPTDDETKKLIINSDIPVYDIQRVRYMDGKIFAYEHTIMPTTIASINKEVLEHSIYDHLKNLGLNIEGSHRIVKADRANKIDLETGIAKDKIDPVLVIMQLSYLDDGQPFELSESRFPFENSELIADITL